MTCEYWIVFFFLSSRKESSQQQIVVPVTGIPYQLSTYQLTEENTDFSYRDKRHQSSMVTSIGPQWTSQDILTGGGEGKQRDRIRWAGRVGREFQTPWNMRYVMYLLEHSEFAFVLKVFQTRFYFIVLFMNRIFISQRFNFFLLTPAKDATVLSSIYCLSCWTLWNAYLSRFNHIENKLLDIYCCYRAGVLLKLTCAPIHWFMVTMQTVKSKCGSSR